MPEAAVASPLRRGGNRDRTRVRDPSDRVARGPLWTKRPEFVIGDGAGPGTTAVGVDASSLARVNDVLLLVDVINDFEHDEGAALLASYRDRHGGMVAAIRAARERGLPVVYANDNVGVWDGDAPRLVRHAIENGKGGELVAALAPVEDDRFVVKPRYSAFDHTPLEILLRELEIERILLAGTATEMCVAQTAIAARELGFKVSVITSACACTDTHLEAISLDYLANVVGARLETKLPAA